MCWSQIDAKLDKHEYWDLTELKVGIHMKFNYALLTLGLGRRPARLEQCYSL